MSKNTSSLSFPAKIKLFLRQNWLLLAAIIYAISPIDLLPESVLPVVGYTEDITLLSLELLRRYFGRREGGESFDPSPQEMFKQYVPWPKIIAIAVLITVLFLCLTTIFVVTLGLGGWVLLSNVRV